MPVMPGQARWALVMSTVPELVCSVTGLEDLAIGPGDGTGAPEQVTKRTMDRRTKRTPVLRPFGVGQKACRGIHPPIDVVVVGTVGRCIGWRNHRVRSNEVTCKRASKRPAASSACVSRYNGAAVGPML